MPHPLQQLQTLLAGRGTPSRGTVVSVSGGSLQVSTANGLVIANRQLNDVTAYRPGDAVRLQGNVVLGRRGGGETYVV